MKEVSFESGVEQRWSELTRHSPWNLFSGFTISSFSSRKQPMKLLVLMQHQH